MEIRLKKPGKGLDWLRLYCLYLEAFPASERKPFSRIRRMYREGRTDVWCILRRGQFVGLAATVNGTDTVLLDYLAVSRSCRGKGVGSAAMAALLDIYRDRGVFVEIETIREDCANMEERLRRRQFYLRSGMVPMKVMISLFGVEMELLGFDCRIDYDRYHSFYMEHLGSWAAGHIDSRPHPEG